MSGGIFIKRNYTKEPMNFTEQLKKLSDKGLRIENPVSAENMLKRINYYRLSIYWKRFLKEGKGFDGDTDFSQVIKLYEFDRSLKIFFLKYLEDIEIAIRSNVSYLLAEKYGKYGYLDSSNFESGEYHRTFMGKLKDEIERSTKNETFLKHHFAEYSDPLPIWKSIEVLSFSTLSMLYKNMRKDDKDRLARDFYGLSHKPVIDQWLHTLTTVRNIAAHHGRLWNRKINPPVKKTEAKIWKTLMDGRNDSLYAILIIFKYLLERERFLEMLEEFELLLGKSSELEFLYEDLALPKNWKSILTK